LPLISLYPGRFELECVAQELHGAPELGILGLELLDCSLYRAIMIDPLGMQSVTQRLRNLKHLFKFR
jgi:hypothetical protein